MRRHGTITFRRFLSLALASLVAATLLIIGVTFVAPAGGVDEPGLMEAVQKVIASDGGVNHFFGHSVAVSGDTAVVGAYNEATNGSEAGAAYVFVRTEMGWMQQAKLLPSDGGPSANFGRSVSVSGDTVLVGAPYHDHDATGGGAAYVFVRTGDTWSQQAELLASDRAPFDSFGYSVALEGDTAVVGAHYHDHNGTSNAGSAYVFVRSGSAWMQQAELLASHRAPDDTFGGSVALSGDTAIVGASAHDDEGTNSGAAFVFYRTGSSWTQQAELTANDGMAYAWFGASVAISGDTALVGAHGDSGIAVGSGAAYVYTRSAGSWSQHVKLTASDATGGFGFGSAVALSGDRALIGAQADDAQAYNSGSAYAFTRSFDVWSQKIKLVPEDGAAQDNFGSSVALSDDVGVVGAPHDDDSGDDSGSAYIYDTAPVFAALAGDDRYETAVVASEYAYPAGADAVVLATGQNWPDALGGSALAGVVDGPVLLTRTYALPPVVASEILRLAPDTVYVLGGTGAISTSVEAQLVQMLPTSVKVTRLAGPDRYATATQVAREVITLQGQNYDGTALFATGANFPDALAGAPIAAAKGEPIVLVDKHGGFFLPPEVTHALILGGTGAVPPSAETWLIDHFTAHFGSSNVVRNGGADRYETAALVADYATTMGLRWDGVGIATGENFPDALAGGAMLGAEGSVLLLTRTDSLPPVTRDALVSNKQLIHTLRYFGGTGAVSQSVRDACEAAVR